MVTHVLPCVSTKVMDAILLESLHCLEVASTVCDYIFRDVTVRLSNSKKASYVFLSSDEANRMV